MNVSEMVTQLSYRVEDANERIFTTAIKLYALNNAQDSVAKLVDLKYLPELRAQKTGITVTTGVTGKLTSSLLGYDLLRGEQGIIFVKNADTGGKYCRVVLSEDIKNYADNTLYTPSVYEPVVYFRNGCLYVLPASIASIDIGFYKVPNRMEYLFNCNADGTPSTTKFVGVSGQGLSTTNDYYNGAVIRSLEKSAYFVITDYVGASLQFIVSPAATGNFGDSQQFYFALNTFGLIATAGTTQAICELSASLHELVLDFAESELWGMRNASTRSLTALNRALKIIEKMNEEARS